MSQMESIRQDWKDLEVELSQFQINHKEYVKKLDEVELLKRINFQKYEKFKRRLIQMKSDVFLNSQDEEANELRKSIIENLNYMNQISDTFPRKNGSYLNIILGGVNVSILNKEEKWKYKEEYEKFKFILTVILQLYSIILLLFTDLRVFDVIMNFLLVWYYCTLTIRESILVVNGSKIRGWWRLHHFIATVCSGILLIWPESHSYRLFRTQYMFFICYISFIQILQYYYQSGCLYRLRALGEKEEMDTTSDGFQVWMFRGLYFLLPFLIFGYLLQAYNSYVLYKISQMSICNEWQVFTLSIIFLVLSLGNILTTYLTVRHKIRERVRNVDGTLRFKYSHWRNLLIPSVAQPNEKQE